MGTRDDAGNSMSASTRFLLQLLERLHPTSTRADAGIEVAANAHTLLQLRLFYHPKGFTMLMKVAENINLPTLCC